MATITDPALELTELCEALRNQPDNVLGEQVLASQFRAEPWSAEFCQTLFVVNHRFEELALLVNRLDIHQVLKNEADRHIRTIKCAFSRDGLNNHWIHAKNNYLTAAAVGPVRFLSPMLQPKHGYARLDDEEITTLLEEVDQLVSWLVDHQLKEQDFFRAAIIEGLTVFRFRMERLRWLGWGYSLAALRDVIQAYLALNGIIPDRNARPDAGSMVSIRRGPRVLRGVDGRAFTASGRRSVP